MLDHFNIWSTANIYCLYLKKQVALALFLLQMATKHLNCKCNLCGLGPVLLCRDWYQKHGNQDYIIGTINDWD